MRRRIFTEVTCVGRSEHCEEETLHRGGLCRPLCEEESLHRGGLCRPFCEETLHRGGVCRPFCEETLHVV